MSRSRRAFFVKHLLWPVLAAAVCCLIWVVVLGRAEQERSRAGTQAAHDAASLAAAYEQYLTRSVAQMDQTTMQLKHSWEHGNPSRLLESLKQDGMFTDPGFVAVLLLAPDGSVRSSIRERRLDGAAALADTAFFKDHKNNISTALRMGVAPASLGYPDETILFTRRLDTSADEFDGVVVLAVQARYFTDFLGPATLGPQGLVAVSANDGAVQVATRDSKAAARRLPANAGLWSADEGVRLLPGQGADAFGDGVARTLAWRRSSAYPLVALVGLAQSDSLAGAAQSWRDARLAATLATVVLLAMGMLASVLAIRAEKR
jgi:hypothetical protein